MPLQPLKPRRIVVRSTLVARPAHTAAVQTRTTGSRLIPEPDTRVTATDGVTTTAAMAATTTPTDQGSLVRAATTAPRVARRAGIPLTVAEQLKSLRRRARPLQFAGVGLFVV